MGLACDYNRFDVWVLLPSGRALDVLVDVTAQEAFDAARNPATVRRGVVRCLQHPVPR
jgi:hypothetical protein